MFLKYNYFYFYFNIIIYNLIIRKKNSFFPNEKYFICILHIPIASIELTPVFSSSREKKMIYITIFLDAKIYYLYICIFFFNFPVYSVDEKISCLSMRVIEEEVNK